MSAIRATVMRREAMIVGARKVNGFHGLFQFLSSRPIARLASGFGKTRDLLVKYVKGGVVSPYFENQKCLLKYIHG